MRKTTVQKWGAVGSVCAVMAVILGLIASDANAMMDEKAICEMAAEEAAAIQYFRRQGNSHEVFLRTYPRVNSKHIGATIREIGYVIYYQVGIEVPASTVLVFMSVVCDEEF